MPSTIEIPSSIAMMKSFFVLMKPLFWLWRFARSIYWGKFKGHPYIFDKYSKRVTVYRDGHGLICNTIHVTILDINRFHTIRRSVDIRDACKATLFDSFEIMNTQDISKRLSGFGFWYEPHDVISRVNSVIDDHSKTLSWDFLFDTAKLKKDKVKKIRLSYSMSVPCLFPITDGKFDAGKAPTIDYVFSSGLSVKHRIKELIYTISLEKGVEITEHPILKIFPHGQDYSVACEIGLDDESDLFYNRYVGKIKKPGIGAQIKAEWKILETS